MGAHTALSWIQREPKGLCSHAEACLWADPGLCRVGAAIQRRRRPTPVSDEAGFVAKINELRAGKGLAPLQVNANLVAKARAWSAGHGRRRQDLALHALRRRSPPTGRSSARTSAWAGRWTASTTPSWPRPTTTRTWSTRRSATSGSASSMSGSTIFVTEVFMQLMPAKTAPVVDARHDTDHRSPGSRRRRPPLPGHHHSRPRSRSSRRRSSRRPLRTRPPPPARPRGHRLRPLLPRSS